MSDLKEESQPPLGRPSWAVNPMTYWKPKENDLCFLARKSRVQSVWVCSFIQKCHNSVINKESTVGQPGRTRDIRNRTVGREGERARGSRRKKKKRGNREKKTNRDADVCQRRRGAVSELSGPW